MIVIHVIIIYVMMMHVSLKTGKFWSINVFEFALFFVFLLYFCLILIFFEIF